MKTRNLRRILIGLFVIAIVAIFFNNCSKGFQSAASFGNGSAQSASTSPVGPNSTGINTSTPAILSVSGTIKEGSTISIIGSGFGLKSPAAPLYWGNYDNDPVGTTAQQTGLKNLNGYDPNPPRVDNTRAVSGTHSLRMDYPLNENGSFPEVGLSGLSATEVYVSAWLYWQLDSGSGNEIPIIKLVRAEAGTVYHGYPGFYETIRPNAAGQIIGTDRGSISSNGTVTNDDVVNAGQNAGGWHRIEYYYKLSTPGVANGVFQTWVDGVLNANVTNTMSRAAGNTATINNIISPFDGISGQNNANSYTLWVDNLYIDTTRARVEIGNAATFSKCTMRFIQPATSWSDGSISVTVNLSQFTSGEKVYVYVVAPNGNVNNNGFPVTVGG